MKTENKTFKSLVSWNDKILGSLWGQNSVGKVLPPPYGSSYHLVWHKSRQPQQVISGSHKPSGQVCPANAFITGFTKPSDRLHPPKDFFHLFPNTLAYCIPAVVGRTSVYRRPS